MAMMTKTVMDRILLSKIYEGIWLKFGIGKPNGTDGYILFNSLSL